MPQPITVIDAFTDAPYAGNPAAVCVLPGPADETWMALVAREMGLSETAFLYREDDAWRLRWFTPTVEVDLCGHATLAAAHALWEQALARPDGPIRFRTRSGELAARRVGGGVELDFPAQPAAPLAEPPAGLAEALGAAPVWLGRNRFDLLAELAAEAAVRDLRPGLEALAALPYRGIIVTARGSGAYDFVSRFFAPRAGVPEDPVTGSAHCCLGPFWAERLGRTELTGYQASARGGVVGVRVAGSRVALRGLAVTVLRGELLH
jgi:predicted PhzF superfamily epimerase YddE/YHI9